LETTHASRTPAATQLERSILSLTVAGLLNCANPQLSLKSGRGVDKFCQRFEKLLGFAGMLQAVTRLPSVGLVPDDLGQAQRCQNVTHPPHASANGARDLARAQFLSRSEDIHNRESQWVAQEAAET
jgi:hypothetical protein